MLKSNDFYCIGFLTLGVGALFMYLGFLVRAAMHKEGLPPTYHLQFLKCAPQMRAFFGLLVFYMS
jgi:hypothetical protein